MKGEGGSGWAPSSFVTFGPGWEESAFIGLIQLNAEIGKHSGDRFLAVQLGTAVTDGWGNPPLYRRETVTRIALSASRKVFSLKERA